MKTHVKLIAAAAALMAAGSISAQSSVDRAFTTAGQDCNQVTWSSEMLAKYPNIGTACQEVMQKDGKNYVKFEGEVKKVARNGTELVVDMKGGGDLTLRPDADDTVFVGGRKVGVRSLRPGDQLNFYVPEDRLVAAVMETPAAPVQEIEMGPAPATEQVAMTSEDYTMPRTASAWPMLALGGLLALCLAGGLRMRRALLGR